MRAVSPAAGTRRSKPESPSAPVADDRAREIEPGALRLVGVMNDAARVSSSCAAGEANDRVGQMRRVRRPSALIVDDAQRVRSFANLIADRLDEVRTVHAEEPRRAEDDVLPRDARGLFAEELRAAVRRERRGHIVDFVRRPFRAVEDKVGRDLDEQRAGLVRRIGEELDRGSVDRSRQMLVRFRVVDFRVRGAVDDDVRLRAANCFADRGGIGDVEIGSSSARRRSHRAIPARRRTSWPTIPPAPVTSQRSVTRICRRRS